jgi:hypothetical protein
VSSGKCEIVARNLDAKLFVHRPQNPFLSAFL